MAADVLVMLEARASAAMILTQFSWHILGLAQESLKQFHLWPINLIDE